MKKTWIAIALFCLAGSMAARATEAPAEQLKLKDGSSLFVHADGTGRMVDAHGKSMRMKDGVAMQAADGRMIMMKNKMIWVTYGPPGKGITVQKTD